MTNTWFILPNGLVVQPTGVVKTNSGTLFVTYKERKGFISPAYIINSDRFEKIAEVYSPYGKYKNSEELKKQIAWREGIVNFLCYYTDPETFKGSPVYKDIVAFHQAYFKLKQSLREKLDVNIEDL